MENIAHIDDDGEIPAEALESPDKLVSWRIQKFVKEHGTKEYDHAMIENLRKVVLVDMKEHFTAKKDINVMIIPDMANPGNLKLLIKDEPDNMKMTFDFIGDKDVLQQLQIIIENTAMGVVKELPHTMTFDFDKIR